MGDIMNYRDKGKLFCDEMNNLLSVNNFKMAFVTGGGYAYDSVKYQDGNKEGDFDFMIVYDDFEELPKLIELLKGSKFNFENKYLNLDINLLLNSTIDIIRLSGKYLGTKSTINLVPRKTIDRISNFENDMIIKKIAHNRNTSLFFAYGSDNSRIITNFISPSFVTEDGEDHYIHLDFSSTIENNNIYLGILADAILKGFNENYDAIDFKVLRKKFIKNIHDFFVNNNIDSSCFINLFANNNYFPDYLKEQLLKEFESFGKVNGNVSRPKTLKPIVFTTEVDINYPSNSFNFINNKPFKTNFDSYIYEMQNNEYDRQYLLDAIGKFFGYLSSSKLGDEEYKGSILDKILVYGVNDLYLPDYEKYSLSSIIKAIIKDLQVNSEKLNNELIRNYLIISIEFLEKVTSKKSTEIMHDTKINSSIFNPTLDPEMQIDVIKKLNSFNEIGTYHNYSSKVMPKYTVQEANFLDEIFNKRDGKVLDIMCGYGRLANALVNKGYSDVTGIDTERYDFLGIPKDFKYINDDFLKHNFSDNYDYAYSLYNCYGNVQELYKNIYKARDILNRDGILIIDFFNKEWRDMIEEGFYKELYKDDQYKLVVKRTYNKNTGDETTYYELYYLDRLIKSWQFTQKFFNLEEVTDIIDSGDWSYSLYNSSGLTTRTNEQKNIMIMRKKI